jgi:hypothetical protein
MADEVVIAGVPTEFILALAAFATAVGGIATTIMALRRDRSEEHEKCLERLKESRAESERFAAELHRLKMQNEEK